MLTNFKKHYRKAFSVSIIRVYNFKARRPHQSFKLTRRKDALRPLALPGVFALTNQVWRVLWQHKATFLLLALVYALLTAILVGVSSQATYQAVSEELGNAASDVFGGDFGQVSQAILLFTTAATGAFSETMSDVQQIYTVLIGLMVWLTTIWLLRNFLAGHAVKLRDGLYNALSPLVSLLVVFMVIIVQLMPIAIALFGYSAAVATGFISGGVEAMLFWLVAGALSLLSLFWVSGTFFALIIVAIPGMYPWRAIQVAGDVVTGRRIQLLLRLIWMVVITVLVWALVVIPFIIFDSWLKDIWPAIEWLPIIPVLLLILSSLSTVWVSAYTYMLYRKVIDEEIDV